MLPEKGSSTFQNEQDIHSSIEHRESVVKQGKALTNWIMKTEIKENCRAGRSYSSEGKNGRKWKSERKDSKEKTVTLRQESMIMNSKKQSVDLQHYASAMALASPSKASHFRQLSEQTPGK